MTIFNFELLENKLQEDKATLINIVNVNKKNTLTSESRIYFKCKCGKENDKKFFNIINKRGCFCVDCSDNIYDYETLINRINNDNASLIEVKHTNNNNTLTRESRIYFNCKCGNKHNKSFRQLNTSGGLCIECTKKSKNQKCVEKCREEKGVDYIFQSQDFKDNSVEYYRKEFNVDNASQVPEYKEKRVNTFVKRFGVDNPAKDKEIHSKMVKTSFNSYDYTFPSGRIERIQGYEDRAINKLLREGIREDDIEVDNDKLEPIIYYKDGKQRVHHIDILIKSQNRIIEAKSTWTRDKKEDNIFLKQQAAKEQGYDYEIWVMSKKGELLECFI